MTGRNFKRNEYQFDYFSENFYQLEQDYNRLTKSDEPFFAIVDSILDFIIENHKNYFKLPAHLTTLQQDCYFQFKIQYAEEKGLIKKIVYQGIKN
ncbi:MAG: DUF5960 family protein [Streptococcaceae bacterium]|jgi:hypothetical protein|nr:DUF5960 family protein [Streptococcaceae bacterium]